jgi:hypothetical protein
VVPARIRLARATLAIVAILLTVWFAVLARNEAVGTEASQRVIREPHLSTAEWQRLVDRIGSADLLDPSTDWSLVQAQYLLLRDPRAALRVADSVLEKEPDNLNAWWVILRGARGIAPERRREAIAQLRRLNPPRTGG